MAKKKTKDENAEVLVKNKAKFFDDFADSLFDASSIMDENKKVISVSPSFDLATGGVPEGTFMALTGKEKIGKTTLALWIAAQAQKMENTNEELCPEGRMLFYSQIEHRIKSRDMSGIPHLILNPDRFKLIQSRPGHILSSQEHCTRIERAINEVPGCIVIVDSFSLLSSQEEQAAEIGYQDRGKSNTIISQLMRKIAAPLAINKCIVIGITHGMANTSGYGAAFQEKSANALKYAEDIKLAGKGVTAWRIGKDEKSPQIGQKVDWLVQFASINAPGGRVNTHFRYNHGIDIYSELAEIGEQFGLIEPSGAWYKLAFLGENAPAKLNGLEQVRNALEQNPEWYNLLRTQVYELGACSHLIGA